MPWEGRRVSELTFERLCRHSDGDRKKRPGGLGGHADSPTHIHTLTHTHLCCQGAADVAGQEKGSPFSSLHTNDTLVKSGAEARLSHTHKHTHPRQKQTRTCAHTHTHGKKTTPKYTHTAATAAPIMKAFFLSKKKKTTPLCSCPFPFSPSPPHN